jgi:hypothetical protein
MSGELRGVQSEIPEVARHRREAKCCATPPCEAGRPDHRLLRSEAYAIDDTTEPPRHRGAAMTLMHRSSDVRRQLPLPARTASSAAA